MKKKGKFRCKKIVFLFAVLFIFMVLLMAGTYSYIRVSIGVNKGSIGCCLQDGKLLVSWQTVSDKNRYRFLRYDEGSGEYIFCGEYENGRAELTDVVPGQELVLKMQGVRVFRIFGYDREIAGKPRILTLIPEELDCPVLTKTADLEKKCVKVTWDTKPGDRYEVYLMNAEGTMELYTEETEGETVFSMEECAELSGREREIDIAVRTKHSADDYVLYSLLSDVMQINRVDLMDDEVHLTYEESGELQYRLSWQESKSDWYELQEWSFEEEKWISRQVYQWSDILSYDTGRLPSGTKMRYRVVTDCAAQTGDRQAHGKEPEEVTFRTQISPLYCTIWPLTALDMTADISGETVMEQVPAGETLCVLEETEGCFFVRYNDKYGYIDARYCLIDLAEYLGDFCAYNITNSYASIFRVHGYDIPEVTDSVAAGYENIYMENGRMLVPYLYPCAKKLYQAALRAQEDGYVLCIYDAFRPNEATRYLYDKTEVILDWPVPEKEDGENTEEEEKAGEEDTIKGRTGAVEKEITEDETEDLQERQAVDEAATEDGETAQFAGNDLEQEIPEELPEETVRLLEELAPETVESIKGLSEEGLTIFYVLAPETLTGPEAMVPENPEGTAATEVSLLSPEDLQLIQKIAIEDIPVLKGMPWEELLALKGYLDHTRTYRSVMTDNRFRLGSFLAQTVSTHNRGIALDLTLVDAASEEELAMQSEMHDLSWYSIPDMNNENADLLAFYMEGAGYRGIASEWWHFQDDETRNQLQLGYMEKGVSPEGWKKDALGWRYRLADGSYYCAVTVMIEERVCTFNETGYLVEE